VVLNIRHITRGFVLATRFRGCQLLNAVEQLEHYRFAILEDE
jgi:hypothetical protein